MPIKAGAGNIIPTKHKENALRIGGYKNIAGYDCSGNNSGWGIMTGAICILQPTYYNEGLRDVKWMWHGSNLIISPENRLFKAEKEILEHAVWVQYVEMLMSERDDIANDNIAEEIMLGRAYNASKIQPDYIIADGRRHRTMKNISIDCAHEGIADADMKIFVVVCAGILSIARRLRRMEELRIPFIKAHCGGYDTYRLIYNQGYLTNRYEYDHIPLLKKYGASPLHSRKCRILYGNYNG